MLLYKVSNIVSQRNIWQCSKILAIIAPGSRRGKGKITKAHLILENQKSSLAMEIKQLERGKGQSEFICFFHLLSSLELSPQYAGEPFTKCLVKISLTTFLLFIFINQSFSSKQHCK